MQIRWGASPPVKSIPRQGRTNTSAPADKLRFGETPQKTPQEIAKIHYAYATALSRNDLEGVREALDSGLCDPNRYPDSQSRDREFGQPISEAASRGYTDLVALLLEYKANPNVKSRYTTRTPLMDAVRQGNREMVRLLIESGADVAQQGMGGMTVLDFVGYNNRLDLYLEFFRGKVPLNLPGQTLGTPLWAAVDQRNLAVAKQFVADGANLEHKDHNQQNLLHNAVVKGDYDMAKFLVESGLSLTDENRSGSTPLALAAMGTSLRLVQLLIQKGADVNHPSCLVGAACNRNPEVLEKIINHPKFVWNKKSVQRALFQAIMIRNFEAFQRLLPHTQDVNAPEEVRQQQTMLHSVAAGALGLYVDALIAKGADVNRADALGQTPLHSAINPYTPRRETLEVVRTLLERGANPNVQSQFGDTPLSIALAGQNMEVAELLLNYNAGLDTLTQKGMSPLFLAVQACNPAMVERMLRMGANIKTSRPDQVNPLTWLYGFMKMRDQKQDPAGLADNKDIEGTIELLKAYGAEAADPAKVDAVCKEEMERSEIVAYPDFP